MSPVVAGTSILPRVEIAFASSAGDPDPTWVDVTEYVVTTESPITINRGRQDQFSDISPSTLSLVLDNADGTFSPTVTTGPYYGNIKIGRQIRVSVILGAGTRYDRFTGNIDSWVTALSPVGKWATATVSATDALKRLGARAALRDLIGCEYLLDSPVAYYPLGEPEGATIAGNASSVASAPQLTTAQYGADGTLEFGAGIGPSTDALTAPILTPVSVSAGKYLTGTKVDGYGLAGITGGTIECFFLSSNSTDTQVIATAWNGDVKVELRTVAGKLNARIAYFVDQATVTSSATVTDGATHHGSLTWDITGGNLTLIVYVDGVQAATTTITWAGASYAFRTFMVGGTSAGNLFAGTLAHAAVYASALTAARLLVHSNAGATGFTGERSDQRVTRILGYAGIPSSRVTAETGLSTVQAQDITGLQPLDAALVPVRTENGLLFIDGSGQFQVQARTHRYNQATTLTLAAGEYEADLSPTLDDTGVVNDVTINQAGGVSVRSVDTDSVTDHGPYVQTLDSITTSAGEVTDAAQWHAHINAQPRTRCPSVSIDLGTLLPRWDAVQVLQISDRVVLSDLPTQVGADLAVNVEGMNEQISIFGYILTLNATPSPSSAVWVLDSPSYSQLGESTVLAY